jgi:rSAM/selenodomain-associated transferase 2
MASLSVVIPTLNAAGSLARTLDCLGERRDAQVIVADGGSADGTMALARAAGAEVVQAPRGRGPQLAAGAAAARGDWLLFLHADTALAPGWRKPAEALMAQGEARAGYFRFALDDASAAARRLERFVAWRCRALALPYGDQGLLIARRRYQAVGGFAPIPLMEDVDLARRLARRGLVALDHAAVTSAQRYRAHGYRRRGARNLLCLSLYFLGVPPGLLARLYG